MTQKRKGLRSMLLALVGCTCSGTAAADSHPSSQTLYPLGTQGSFAGPDNLFTGDVKVDILFPENEKAHFSGAYVHFAPGAHPAWHTHPAGQHMIVTDGIALTGTRAGDVFAFSAGETAWCPPDIDHWHGAEAGRPPPRHDMAGNEKGTPGRLCENSLPGAGKITATGLAVIFYLHPAVSP